ncbi:MAG: NAD(P)/FAD-dependent oxidoreductase [Burkholderiales bacterium]
MKPNHKETRLTKDSYYEASVNRTAPSPTLAGDINADVCVVGAGFSGLSAALELAQRGYSVTVLEAQTVGWGASGRNGGQALVGYANDDAIEAQLSKDDAGRVWQMTVEAMQLLKDRISTHAIDCDFTPGYLSVAVTDKKARELEQWVNLLEQRYQYAMRPIGKSEIQQWISSDRFQGGAFDANSGHLHPLKYCLGLAAAARAAGVRIFENSPVVHVERGATPLVRTGQGSVRCNFVVLAGNVYLNEYGKTVAPELDKRIMSVGTYIVATETMGKARADALIAQRAAVCDTNFVLDYFRPTADHRMLFGGRVSYTTATPINLVGSMRQRMLAVFPQLADLKVPYAWGGFVDVTMNRAPDFGRLDSNLFYLQGFSGHGVVLSGIAGKLAAEAIAGQAERFDLIGRIKHHAFPGGRLLRAPAQVLGMLYYQLKELL